MGIDQTACIHRIDGGMEKPVRTARSCRHPESSVVAIMFRSSRNRAVLAIFHAFDISPPDRASEKAAPSQGSKRRK